MKFSRYLVFNFIKMFLLVLLGAIFMFIVIDFVGNIRVWLARDLKDAEDYYIAYFPYILYLVTPVALFIGVVASVGNMARHLEMMAIQESGLSPFRVLVPIFGVGLLLTAGSWYLDANVLPDANHKRYEIMEPMSQQRRDPRIKDKRDFAYIGGDKTSWYMKMYGGDSKLGRDVLLLIYRNGDLAERYDARRLRWIAPVVDTVKTTAEKDTSSHPLPKKVVNVEDSGYWQLEEGYQRVFQKDGTITVRHFVRESLKQKTSLRPEDFLDERQRGDEMDAKTILRRIEALRRSGESTRKLETAYYFKFSGSMMNFLVLLIGAALAHRFSRSGGLSQKFGVGIFLVFSYYVVIRIGLK
ncbi:MAG: LptF/LptG family permease, partial [Fibrobacteraceae bacterium]|nr:LptF/LptG family permease [Fibrobacteraceae bacterium]